MTLRYQYRQHRFWHVTITVLMVLTCLRVWIGPVSVTEEARAQIPDAGTQRMALVKEAKRTNQLLTEIKQLLEEHTLNVRIQGADNQSDKPARPRGGGQ